MSTTDQRKQWADHIADEGRALELQQRAAGATHSPSEGPLPYTENELLAAAAAAVAAERERCARVADRWCAEAKLLEHFGHFTEAELRAGSVTACTVAAEIRRGDEPPSR